MTISLIALDSARTATLSTTAVIPVLDAAVGSTGSGPSGAGGVTLSTLAAYIGSSGQPLTSLVVTNAANTVNTTLTGGGKTGSNASSTVSITDTWNTSGVVTAFKLAIIDTARGVGSLVFDLLAGSAGTTSVFNVDYVGNVSFYASVVSTGVIATPSAYAATKAGYFASTVSGATLMGFGTTGDVTLKNRAGTDVIVVTSNTTGVTMAGALAIVGALSGVTTLAVSSTSVFSAGVTINGVCQLGTAGGANLITIGGTAYGAGVASVRLNGLTTAAQAGLTGTLTNAPSTGNPAFWAPIMIDGNVRYFPCWS